MTRRRTWRQGGVLTAVVLICGSLSPAPSPVAAADPVSVTMHVTWTRPGLAGTLAPPSPLRVGDQVTIDFTMSGLTRAGCSMFVHHVDAFAVMAAGQDETEHEGIGYCRPWTFIVPPIAAGRLEIDGSIGGDDTDGGDASWQSSIVVVNLQAGGTPRPYTSSYPVPSWHPPDILGTATPRANTPLVFARPPGATRNCSYEIGGDSTGIGGRALDRETCPNWEVTLPDPRSQADVESPFGRPWNVSIGVGGGTIDPLTGAAISGGARTPRFDIDGDGGDELLSNLPTGIASESTHPRFAVTGSTITINPEFLNIPGEGECEHHVRGPTTPDDGIQWRVPFADGRCEPGTYVATEPGLYTASATAYVDGEAMAMAGFGVEVVEPMPPPSVEIAPAVKGEPFDVSASVSAGLPYGYEIQLAPTADAGASLGSVAGLATGDGATMSSSTCASGALDFHGDDRDAAGRCVSLAAGSHRITVAFEDVTGATRTRTRTITVLAFRDIVGNKFALDITWLAVEGITSGCTSTSFCPDGLVTRGQMATFLTRALNLPATSRDYFTDDESSTHEANINRLRAAGITAGCGGTRFCPNGVVTRAQMATFLVRAFNLPATSTDFFTDDESSTHEANINRLRAAGVTSGCGGTRYCPGGSVTRGQMAAFLHRAVTD